MRVSDQTLRSITTPERVDSPLEALDFVDGFPSPGGKQTMGRAAASGSREAPSR